MAQDQWKPPSYATEWIPPSYAEPSIETPINEPIAAPIPEAPENLLTAPNMLKEGVSRLFSFGTKGMLGHEPSMEEWMNTPAYAAKEQGLNILTSPLGMVGELGAGIGMGMKLLKGGRQASEVTGAVKRLENIPMSGELKGFGDVSTKRPLREYLGGFNTNKGPFKSKDAPITPSMGDYDTPVDHLTGALRSGIPREIPPDPAQQASMLGKVNNFAKTMLTSYDMSAPGRQGKQLWMTTSFWTSFDDMFKSYGSQKAFDEIMGGIKQRPLFVGPKGQSVAERAGLDLPDILNTKEERFVSGLAQKIPGVKPSERAYTAFLNKLRADHFETLVEKYTIIKDSPLDDKELSDLAHTINTATGRGDLGRYNENAKFLNEHFFAPKFVASRLRTLDPRYYLSPNISPYARREAWKNLAALVSASMIQNSLYALAGGKVGMEIANSDFAKSAFGATRMDPNAGVQQPLTAAIKMMHGLNEMRKGSKEYGRFGKNTPLDTAIEFAMQRTNPVQSFVLAMMRGTDMDTQPFTVKNAIANRLAPIMLQDIMDLYNEDPNLLPLMIPAMMGDSMNVYTK